ncbi:hypothetical protein B7494_g2799 [Chlorociboria aeruginascens]|nr:hypothetical protein B7494_g2799 [Chlorociboria aeruginascens]
MLKRTVTTTIAQLACSLPPPPESYKLNCHPLQLRIREGGHRGVRSVDVGRVIKLNASSFALSTSTANPNVEYPQSASMVLGMNPFRILGDVSHTLSKCILIWSIHRNSSAEGVSLISQVLYALVFLTRYLDLFSPNTVWNHVLKVVYILTSLYTILLMMRVYPRTREREKAWKLGGACLGGAMILSPFVMMIFEEKRRWSLMETFYTFSLILESVLILPQLLLLRQTTVPTVIDSYYLLTLGSYRFFYILNWIWRELDTDPRIRKPSAIAIIFGVIQTALYFDFAWVYYSRQRVKLRNGGIVDEEDIGRGWLLSKILGHKTLNTDNESENGDEEAAPALSNPNASYNPAKSKSRWGTRGISVSADEGVLENESHRGRGRDRFGDQEEGILDTDLHPVEGDADAKMNDPDELARILDDEADDWDDGLPGNARTGQAGGNSGVGMGNGGEWREGRK